MNLHSYADPSTLPPGEPSRVARLLALPDSERVDDVQLARRVSDGLDPAAVVALSDVLGRSQVIGPIVPEATLRRVRKAGKRLPRELSERLYEVGRVVDAVSLVYHGDEQAIDAFLKRPHPLLDGATPFELATSCSAGSDAVLNLMRRVEASVVV